MAESQCFVYNYDLDDDEIYQRKEDCATPENLIVIEERREIRGTAITYDNEEK